MLNWTSLLFEQSLPGTDRIGLIPSKKALIIEQKSPDNGTILYPRFGVNDNEFYFLLLHLQHLSPQSKGFVSLHGRDVSQLTEKLINLDFSKCCRLCSHTWPSSWIGRVRRQLWFLFTCTEATVITCVKCACLFGPYKVGTLESSFDILLGNIWPSVLIEFNTSLSQLVK